MENPVKKILFGLIALAALTAACHEERQDPPPDYGAVRAHSNNAQGQMGQESAAHPSDSGQ
jgi:nitrous oxide reductase accessory protein NosL